MTCDEMRERMSAQVDGALDDAEERRLAEHLATCGACGQELAAIQRLVQSLHGLPPVPPPPDLNAKIRARVRAAQSARPSSRIIRFIRLPQTRVAIAAGLLVVVTVLSLRQLAPAPISRPTLTDSKSDSVKEEKMKVRAEGSLAARRTDAEDGDGDRTQPPIPVAAEMSAAPSAPPGPAGLLRMPNPSVHAKGGEGKAAELPLTMPLKQPAVEDQYKKTAKEEVAAQSADVTGQYTFRTDRIAEAAVLVRSHACDALGRKLARRQSDTFRETRARDTEMAEAVVADKGQSYRGGSQPVTVEVTLAAADLPGVLDELRRLGSQNLALANETPGETKQDALRPAASEAVRRKDSPNGQVLAADATESPAITQQVFPESNAADHLARVAQEKSGASISSGPVAQAGQSAPAEAAATANRVVPRRADSAPATVTVRFLFLPPQP